ncbi:pyridoxamine 5'-phosphate oxidase [Arenibacter sp. TNZ]|jgi:pyridoxine/pyridoxamine 5'-phosphate oxidase|uniref:pyridoxamine 5'-phosphate oxidase family protein n=1 Tax=Arenibacter TaxID=178469 RepID=UPI000CD3BC75|nr:MULTISPECIES: pyridoxamine 5'-phosphate oxidase family protein [Arenibacter]MCM4169954.1 pyridoxamine 5'-phosphate oxidase [Arenibacter sp. TNZ]
MATIYLQEIREELQKGPTEKDHPFKFFTFSTVGLDQVARLRTVVLREVSKDLKLTFYTDKRSKKITHIKENKKVSLLLYHPSKLIQIKIEGTAAFKDDNDTKEKYWSKLDTLAKKQYTTTRSPGSNLINPQNLEYLSEENHFCLVEITPYKIEYLKLSQPNHIRVRFSKVGNLWESEYLVP